MKIDAIVSKTVFLLIAQFAIAVLTKDSETTEVKPVLYGNGQATCEDDLPTLSVASENIIRTKAQWDDFVANNQFFIVAAADSTCQNCCVSEPLLRDLLKVVKDKASFSYPEVNKKQKKIVRREIKLARVDLNDKELVEKLAANHIWFPMGTTVYIAVGGRFIKYDGMFADFNMLAHHMQRAANPVINLTSEEQIMKFLSLSDQLIWEEDYSGELLPKGQTFDNEKKLEKMARLVGYNTRVVAFYYDKAEYAEEITALKHVGIHLSNRYNLRIGLVTGEKLVTKMKKAHPDMFNEAGMSSMVLKRYDGTMIKMNVNEEAPARYLWWITIHSTKPVDELTPAGFQLSETARMPMITIFVDFKSSTEVAEKSANLISILEKVQPMFKERFMFFWTDDSGQLANRRILGITWDQLPALAVNSLDHIVFAYPKDQQFEQERIVKWLKEVSLKKTAEGDMVVKDFVKRQRDPTIYDNFLERTIKADRDVFEDQILREESDSVLFIYSTENVNYVQRKAAFSYNLVVETLSNEALYPGLVGNKLKFYSYDAYQHAFPKGIPFLSSPPQDTDGTKIVSEEQRKAGLPAIYIFPSEQKGLPYMRYMKFPVAGEIIEWILTKAKHDMPMKMKDFENLGNRSIDEQAFHRRLDKEGVIVLQTAFDEL